jgi:ATP-dependent DNA helicase 2 subunit 2
MDTNTQEQTHDDMQEPLTQTNDVGEPIVDDNDKSEDDDSIEVDRGVAEGRIIGNTYPLEDFRANLKSGDVVSKAVEDMAAVIQEIASQPFASRRHDELLMCLKELREACLQEDEIASWNEWVFFHFRDPSREHHFSDLFES